MDTKALFPFEYVPRNSKIIIYGMGYFGKLYIEQVEITKWCTIIGISDKKFYTGMYEYIAPSDLWKLNEADYFIIAIESLTVAVEIYRKLVEKGVPEKKILHYSIRLGQINFANIVNDRIDNILRIQVKNVSGFGDILLMLPLLKKIKDILGSKCEIIAITPYRDYVNQIEFIDKSYDVGEQVYDKEVDVCFTIDNIVKIDYIFEDKVRLYSEKFFLYCKDILRYQNYVFGKKSDNYRIHHYCQINKKNRIEMLDINGILGVSRYDDIELPLKNQQGIMVKYNLVNKKIILVNRDCGKGDEHTKLWPVQYYVEFLKSIKTKYPQFTIVLIGKEASKELSVAVDIDLTGLTTLNELACILSQSELLISSEGGLVHFRHFLSKNISLVFFGPTSIEIFGYEENINLTSSECNYNCCWMTDDWMSVCPRGENVCMREIYPSQAMDMFEKIISDKKITM